MLENKPTHICSNCGYLGRPKSEIKGSCLLEGLLWLFFIIPGIIYTIMRSHSATKVCPKCKSPNMVPVNTPRGQELIQKYNSKI